MSNNEAIRARQRIVMVVNNPGSNDYRVVKSAESLVRAGHECLILGALKADYASEEEINGVHYKRVKIPVGPFCMVAHTISKSRLPHSAVRVWLIKRLLCSKAEKIGTDASPDIFVTRISNLLFTILKDVLSILFSPIRVSLEFLSLLLVILQYTSYILFFPIQVFLKLFQKPAERYEIDWFASFTRKYVLLPRVVRIKTGKLVKKLIKKIRVKTINIRKATMRYLRQTWLDRAGISHDYLLGRYLATFYPQLLLLDADAYHCHEIWPLQACVLAAQETGVKLVYDSHELEAYRNTKWPEKVMDSHRSHEKGLIPYVNEVISVSPCITEILKEMYSLPKVWLLRNIPLRPASTSGGNLRSTIDIPSSTPLLIYVGAVTFNRGLEQLLDALRLLPSYHLATVGPIQDNIREEISKIAADAGISERFHITGKVPPDELVAYISSADVSVLPIQNACLSYYHCLPNKLFESMFAGVPVAASDFPDMSEIITEWGVGGVFDEKNPQSIAACIESVYTKRNDFYDEEKLTSIHKTLCFENESKVLVDLYQQLR